MNKKPAEAVPQRVLNSVFIYSRSLSCVSEISSCRSLEKGVGEHYCDHHGYDELPDVSGNGPKSYGHIAINDGVHEDIYDDFGDPAKHHGDKLIGSQTQDLHLMTLRSSGNFMCMMS